MTWTYFWDMHSGGRQKLSWSLIYIEAPEAEARTIFRERLGRDPDNVTCDCCGEDYAVSSGETLAAVSAFHRGEETVYGRPDDDAMSVEDYERAGGRNGGTAVFLRAPDFAAPAEVTP